MTLQGIEERDGEIVTQIVREAGTSFYHGMKILEADRRIAMYGIYAFCRIADDIADEDMALPKKRAALDDWRQRIARLYAGTAEDSVTRVLRGAIQAYKLKEADFQAIIDGMEMDAGAAIVAPPLEMLDLYCDRVASAVGRLSILVFGEASAAGQDVAYALGRALQLTNILRDVGEDAQRGRLYLPAEYLEGAAVPADPQAALLSPHLPRVMARIADLAERYFGQAEASMVQCDPKAMRPARLMAASYKPLIGILRARDFANPLSRPRLPKWRKAWLALQLLRP